MQSDCRGISFVWLYFPASKSATSHFPREKTTRIRRSLGTKEETVGLYESPEGKRNKRKEKKMTFKACCDEL